MSLHLQDRLFHEFTQSKQDRERRRCLCLHIPEYRSTSIRADSQQYNARLAVVEILQPVYLFSSPICHFERSEKSVPFCVDNTDFSAMNRLEMTGY